LGWTAQGLTTLKIDSENGHFGIDEVVKITEENDVSTIVVGLPKHMNNSIGESGERSIHYSKLLENSMPDVKILLWDERLSTAGAERIIFEADVTRAKCIAVIDMIAAEFILQRCLDNPEKGE